MAGDIDAIRWIVDLDCARKPAKERVHHIIDSFLRKAVVVAQSINQHHHSLSRGT